MLGVRRKEKKEKEKYNQAGGQTTGPALPDMIPPEAKLSVVISVRSNTPKHKVVFNLMQHMYLAVSISTHLSIRR